MRKIGLCICLREKARFFKHTSACNLCNCELVIKTSFFGKESVDYVQGNRQNDLKVPGL